MTNCQPYGGASLSGSKLIVHAGRKASSGPADFFKEGLEDSNMLPTTLAKDTSPSNLNFALKYTTINVAMGTIWTCPGVRIGQGSTGTTNNWWFAQPGAQRSGESIQLSCTVGGVACPLGLYVNNSVNNFVFDPGSCGPDEQASAE